MSLHGGVAKAPLCNHSLTISLRDFYSAFMTSLPPFVILPGVKVGATWDPSEVAPEDVARYGEASWRDFHDHCLVIGLVCQQ
jgi:hypothetical protein